MPMRIMPMRIDARAHVYAYAHCPLLPNCGQKRSYLYDFAYAHYAYAHCAIADFLWTKKVLFGLISRNTKNLPMRIDPVYI